MDATPRQNDVVHVTCPYCGRTIGVERKHLGSSGKCRCGKSFVIAETYTRTCSKCDQKW